MFRQFTTLSKTLNHTVVLEYSFERFFTTTGKQHVVARFFTGEVSSSVRGFGCLFLVVCCLLYVCLLLLMLMLLLIACLLCVVPVARVVGRPDFALGPGVGVLESQQG